MTLASRGRRWHGRRACDPGRGSRTLLVAVGGALLLGASRAGAVSEGVPAVYDPLLVESPRAVALGNLTVVLPDAAVAALYNPAFLAFDAEPRLAWTQSRLAPEGDDVWLGSWTVSGPSPIGPPGLVAALAFKRLDFGVVDVGIPYEGDGNSFDHALALSGGLPVGRGFAVGAALEYVYSDFGPAIPELNIPEDPSAGTVSLSLGLALAPTATLAGAGAPADASRLRVTPLAGLSLLHLGPGIRYRSDEDREPLFRQAHAGVGLRVAHAPEARIPLFDRRRLALFDLFTGVEANVPIVNSSDVSTKKMLLLFGSELTLFGVVTGRVGFVDEDESGSIRDDTWGFGFALPGVLPVEVRVDRASLTGLDRVHRWGISARWVPAR